MTMIVCVHVNVNLATKANDPLYRLGTTRGNCYNNLHRETPISRNTIALQKNLIQHTITHTNIHMQHTSLQIIKKQKELIHTHENVRNL